MGWRNEQCKKVCRIIDNYLANRPTERDSLIVAVQKAFDALEQPETNCSEIPNNSDTISRQQAIEAFETAAKSGASIEDIKLILAEMPSIQPERKTGRWIPTYEDCCADVWVKWKCSECGYVRKKGWKQTYDGAKPDALFCEMCNADMRGDKHEAD